MRLRRFPIDTPKIDQSFVRDLTTDADDASVVRLSVEESHLGHAAVRDF
jgi:EAL domain-containing protein (putative c-di-GMP-specific phosphodiesterase class I)